MHGFLPSTENHDLGATFSHDRCPVNCYNHSNKDYGTVNRERKESSIPIVEMTEFLSQDKLGGANLIMAEEISRKADS
jgi:hypothetical protein